MNLFPRQAHRSLCLLAVCWSKASTSPCTWVIASPIEASAAPCIQGRAAFSIISNLAATTNLPYAVCCSISEHLRTTWLLLFLQTGPFHKNKLTTKRSGTHPPSLWRRLLNVRNSHTKKDILSDSRCNSVTLLGAWCVSSLRRWACQIKNIACNVHWEKQVTDKNNRRFRGFTTKNKTCNRSQPLLERTRS